MVSINSSTDIKFLEIRYILERLFKQSITLWYGYEYSLQEYVIAYLSINKVKLKIEIPYCYTPDTFAGYIKQTYPEYFI